VEQQNTFVASPDFKKKDKIETKSLNMIDARFNVSMQQEPGFANKALPQNALFSLGGPCSMLVAAFIDTLSDLHVSFDDVCDRPILVLSRHGVSVRRAFGLLRRATEPRRLWAKRQS
jgi:hypothetical protein